MIHGASQKNLKNRGLHGGSPMKSRITSLVITAGTATVLAALKGGDEIENENEEIHVGLGQGIVMPQVDWGWRSKPKKARGMPRGHWRCLSCPPQDILGVVGLA